MSGTIRVFNILLQPAGLHRLFSVDMTALVDDDPSASDVLERAAGGLADAVRAASDFVGQVAAVERWTEAMLERSAPDDAIGRKSQLMFVGKGNAPVEAIVADSGLSASQFQRPFARQVGMSPKLFARTIRFDAALTARRADPRRTWTDIVHDVGYFDQAHFIRECRAFAGLPPTGMVGEWVNVFSPGG